MSQGKDGGGKRTLRIDEAPDRDGATVKATPGPEPGADDGSASQARTGQYVRAERSLPTARPQLYAILDGARNPRIYREVYDSGSEWCCLFAGALTTQVLHASPYLVHLEPGSPLTDFIMTTTWGQAGGILLRSAATFKNLRRHLRTFLRAKLEGGGKVLFRYYDPRIFRVYLPTCTQRELETLFGPVRGYIIEQDDGEALEYRLNDRGLQQIATNIELVLGGSGLERPDG